MSVEEGSGEGHRRQRGVLAAAWDIHAGFEVCNFRRGLARRVAQQEDNGIEMTRPRSKWNKAT